MKNLLIALFIVGMVSCKSEDAQPYDPNAVPQVLIGKWLHSFEEDSGENRIFRPVGVFVLPAAKFRQYFSFNADNTLKFNQLQADGRENELNGKWLKTGPFTYDITYTSVKDQSEQKFTLTIIEILSERMTMKSSTTKFYKE